VSGGVCPPKHLCVFASFPPAQAFVSRHPRKAASTLAEMRGRHSLCELPKKKIKSLKEILYFCKKKNINK
jgi:hypothetical protein